MTTPTPPGGQGTEAAGAADDELEAALRRAAQLFDPIPPGLSETNVTLLSWRDPDAELAALVADSRELASTVRGDTSVVLQFGAGATASTIEIGRGPGAAYRLIGQVEPASGGVVEVRGAAGSLRLTCDTSGRFQADELPGGRISLRWTAPGSAARPIDTPWLLI
jgi:hypothetical protein